ncbi:ribonuclease H-like domain-containing protein [Candidatus Uhrbacteria bacterium]|nr:ribonuclease H-like domain-containing protein [Candidatus Uhrbacteria bacterium]
MSSGEIVFDIETQSAALSDLRALRMSVIGCYFYDTDSFEVFEENELPQLWRRFEHASRLIGYNSKGFDLPVMNNYYSGDFLKFNNLDILEEIHKALGFRLKLDDVAGATIGAHKSGHGLQAVEWWKQGEINKIKEYCLQDVKITRDVYEYGLKYGALAYEDRLSGRKAIPVNFRKTEPVPMKINLTMGL